MKEFYSKLPKALKNDIESISEVLEVKTLGERERLIEIIVNPRTVENYGLTNKDVLESIAKSNLMIPAGTLSNDKGSFNVQVPSLIESREDLLNIPIKSKSNSFINLRMWLTLEIHSEKKLGLQEIMEKKL